MLRSTHPSGILQGRTRNNKSTRYGEHLNPFQILREIKSVFFATVSGGTPQVRIVEANPMMNDLYPGEKRDIPEAFCIYCGVGEIFRIDGEHCLECGRCREVRPAEAIEAGAGL